MLRRQTHRGKEVTLRLARTPEDRELKKFHLLVLSDKQRVSQQWQRQTNRIRAAIEDSFRIVLETSDLLFAFLTEEMLNESHALFPIPMLFTREPFAGMGVDHICEGLRNAAFAGWKH